MSLDRLFTHTQIFPDRYFCFKDLIEREGCKKSFLVHRIAGTETDPLSPGNKL